MAALPAGGLAADTAKKPDKKQQAALVKLQAAAAAAQARDCAKAAKLAAEVVDRDAALLPADMLAAGYMMAASCEAALGDQAGAYRHAVSGSALIESPDELWHMRLAYELDGRRYEAAVVTVEAMTQGRGAALNAIPQQWFYQLDRALKADGLKHLRQRLLAVLAGGSYIPDKPGGSIDPFRIRYAAVLFEAGDSKAAKQSIEQIEDPDTLLDASLDPRFRAFIPADLDLRRRVERKLAETQAIAQRHADLIEPSLRAANYMLALGRAADALALLDSSKDRIADPKAFADSGEQRQWWWDMRARAIAMLGRHDEELAALRTGASVGENGGGNVSQTINMAQIQVSVGRPADALQTLKVFDGDGLQASPYGMMQIRFAAACARTALGKGTEAADDVQFIKDHEGDAPRTVTETMLCIGDLDGAAASFIRRLDDPAERVSALRHLSDFDEPPVPPSPSPLLANLPKVKARADVQAAIARAGGVRRIPLQDVSF